MAAAPFEGQGTGSRGGVATPAASVTASTILNTPMIMGMEQ